jgi:hypothetical protein
MRTAGGGVPESTDVDSPLGVIGIGEKLLEELDPTVLPP